MAANSTAKSRLHKPAKPVEKPCPKFPLWAHPSGRWCKKLRDKFHYFGPVSEGEEQALARYEREWPYIEKGQTPPPVEEGVEGLTVHRLANLFLESKKRQLRTGELAPRSFRDYHGVCELLVDFFGRDRRVDDLRPDDFDRFRSHLAKGRAKRRGPVALANLIGRIRVVFNFAFDADLTERPVRFGKSFCKPSRKNLRVERARKNAERGCLRMFEAAEIRLILSKASPALKAAILLAVNCAYGQTDCARLPLSALDLESGWAVFPRPKTGVDRRAALWPETIEAVKAAIAVRPMPADPADDDAVFLTRFGRRIVRTSEIIDDELKCGGVSIDTLSAEFRKLLAKLNLNGHRGFYCLRHSFQTVADEVRDDVATRLVMGHCDDSMSAVYRESIGDDRLRRIADHVYGWLFAPTVDEKKS